MQVKSCGRERPELFVILFNLRGLYAFFRLVSMSSVNANATLCPRRRSVNLVSSQLLSRISTAKWHAGMKERVALRQLR